MILDLTSIIVFNITCKLCNEESIGIFWDIISEKGYYPSCREHLLQVMDLAGTTEIAELISEVKEWNN